MTTATTERPAPTPVPAPDLPGRDRPTSPTHRVVIEPRRGRRPFDWSELVAYRDLFRFLVWREIKVRYAQSAIGIGWAVIQPVFNMIVFSVVFGRFAGIGSDGAAYPVFSLAALVPWTYFSNALTDGVNSLVGNTNMLSKVYFPRVLIPFSAVAAKLVDFAIAAAILAGLLAWYRVTPSWGVLALPWLTAMMVVTAAGCGLWLSALAVQFRDVKHAMGFVVQLLMFVAPVVYPMSAVPDQYRLIYSLNPLAGVIEGFRSALLATNPMPWDAIAVGSLSATAIAVSGLYYFRGKEKIFADVV